jgi:hypothetical protein
MNLPALADNGASNELDSLWKLANRVARTPFAGNYRGRPEDAFAAILAGREAGLAPMQSLAGIDVIDGRPSFSPELMRALVARAGHRLDIIESTDERCTLAGRRADTGAGAQVTWTIADAQRAGLAGRGAWRTYPRAMLVARATSELCRQLWPDIIAGLSYGPEEVATLRGGEWNEQPAEIDTVVELEPYRGAEVELAELVDDPARTTFDELRALAGTPAAAELRQMAEAAGRRLTVAEFDAYPAWRSQVHEHLQRVLEAEGAEGRGAPVATDDGSEAS